MAAPDYEWWHGFYDYKKTLQQFHGGNRDMIQHNKKAHVATDFPNATGNTTPPKEVFPKWLPSIR